MTEQTQAPKAAKTVTVACKMPNGMLLHLQEPYTDHEQTMNGVREVTRYRKVGDGITVQGFAVPVGAPTDKHVIGGYGLTRGVDAEFWAKWLDQNKDAPYVKNGIIFAMPSRDAAEDRAKEQRKIKSGIEPLETTFHTGKDGSIIPDDPRFPRSMVGVTAIHSGDRT